MTYAEEQKALFLSYLNTHVFSYWREKNTEYKRTLELIVSPICNTKCSYCYYKNYSDQIYPVSLAKTESILKNCESLLKWLQKENYAPTDIEIFSGEFFNLPYHKKILELLAQYLPKDKKTYISIPTNCTFALSEEKTASVQNILDNYNTRESNIYLGLSLSTDGKYLDNDTRALRNGKKYTDEYYDRLFKFGAKNHCGFHPMIGAKGIERWKETIDWFVENISKYYKMPKLDAYRHIYLLEVRNPDWSKKEIDDFKSFINYYVHSIFDLYDRNPKKMYDNFFYKRKNGNLFSAVISQCGRGLGCSIQSDFSVRLGDLALVPCHRTAYDGYNAAHLKFDEEYNMDLDIENPNLYMLIQNFDSRGVPKCDSCPINHICNKFCIGCNFEVNRDFFVPVDTVCDMEIGKTTAIISSLKEIGVLDYITAAMAGNNYFRQMSSEINTIIEALNYAKGEEK